MSEISKYRKKLLGYITCPSDYELIEGSISSKIPIYLLEEDIPTNETRFDGKAGDLLIGGGTGEAEAMRISLPEAVNYLKSNETVFFQTSKNTFKSFWSSNFMFRIANGFTKVGLDFHKSSIELWLTRQIIGWLKDHYPHYLQAEPDGTHIMYKNDLFTITPSPFNQNHYK